MSNKHYLPTTGKDKWFGKQGLTIEVRNGNVEGAIKALKKRVMQEGLLKDIRKHEAYEKPGDKRRREQTEARKRWLKLSGEPMKNPKKKKKDRKSNKNEQKPIRNEYIS
jgi:small subunit ribosomal protein S21